MNDDQTLFNWYLGGVQLLCFGSITAIKDIDPMRRVLTLRFRDGDVTLPFDDTVVQLLVEKKE